MEIYHVIPINDFREHDNSSDCWCNPVVEDEPSKNLVYVHNAMDHREQHETPYGAPLH